MKWKILWMLLSLEKNLAKQSGVETTTPLCLVEVGANYAILERSKRNENQQGNLLGAACPLYVSTS